MAIKEPSIPFAEHRIEAHSKRVLVVLYAGDYREAYHRISSGKGETYSGHKYSIDSLLEIARQVDSVSEVAVLCCKSKEPYDEELEGKLRFLGAAADPYADTQKVLNVIGRYKPTHIVLRIPSYKLLKWSVQNQIKTIAVLADSFNLKDVRSRLSYFMLARILNHRGIEWVGNHGVNACLSLKRIGVNPKKIIPWNLPSFRDPHDFSVRALRTGQPPFRLFFVGSLMEKKGLFDVVRAVSLLDSSEQPAELRIAGGGDIDAVLNLAESLSITHRISYLGVIPNQEIFEQMRAADAVVVPSHHSFPEGFPFVISEALCTRTPLIVSDHPMFIRTLKHRNNALVFPEKQVKDLAENVEALASSPDLYRQISGNALATWESLQIPVLWGDLIKRWVANSTEDHQWLYKHRIESGVYY